MKGFIATLFLALAVSFAAAQSATPTPTPAPNDYTIDFSASFTSTMSAPMVSGTNTNATRITLRGPVTNRFAWRLDNLTLPKDQATSYFAGLEYDRFVSDLFHPKDLKFDASSFQLYVYGEVGGKKQDIASTSAVAFLVGGGIRKHVTGNLWLNAIDVGYLRSDYSHPGVVLSSNNFATSTGFAFRF